MGTKASFIAMFCVMAGMSATVYAAPSIRVIGGDNAYTSAAAASADNDTSSVGTSSRAGSLRVMPAARATTKAATLSGTTPKTTPNTTTVGRTVTTPRLSIGKYVGASRPVSVSSSNLSSDLTKRLDTMESNIQGLSMDKQDNLDGSEFITINDKNEVVLELAALKDELSGMTGAEIEMGTNATHLLWRYVGEPTWKELIALDTIRGDMPDYATVNYVDDEIAAAIAGIDLSNYYTKSETYTQSEADAAIAAAVDGKVDIDQGVSEAGKVMAVGSDGKVSASGDYYTKDEVDAAIAAVPGVSGLGDLAYENLITNDLVSDDAAIERTKMATDIQAALNLIDAAPDDGNQYVLSVVDGVRQWVPVQQ